MSYLLEYRKVNDINIPLYFKFGTILAKENLSADKLLTLENWMKMFDQLNPLLASDASSRKSKTFEMDSGRISVKARWAKINDSSDVGSHIVKILNLNSSNTGKYFLKIDVKLSSYLERIAADLEQKSKSVDVKDTSKETSHDRLNTTKHKKSKDRKISDMLPKIRKDNDDPLAPLDESVISNSIEELNNDDLNNVEEYIPLPTASALTTTDTYPTYNPEKSVPTEMNAVHSEYLPVSTQPQKSTDESELYEPTALTSSAAIYNPEKKYEIEQNTAKSEYSPTCQSTPIKGEFVYKPTKKNKAIENDRTSKILNKSKELFGSSDENSNDEIDKVSSSSQKTKRKMDSSPRRERASSRTKEKEKSKSKKKKVNVVQVKQESISEDSDISIRNFMKEPIDAILGTYTEHEPYLTELYKTHVKQVKRNYKPIDIPDMTALDIVSSEQFTAMIDFLEDKLVRDAEEEHNYSDIIFDLLIPEWALAIFCKKFNCTRSEALERLRLQSLVIGFRSDL